MYILKPTTKFKKDLKKIKGNPILYPPTVSFFKTLEVKGVSGTPTQMKPPKAIWKIQG